MNLFQQLALGFLLIMITSFKYISFVGTYYLFFHAMEGMVKKYQQEFRKVKEEMSQWDELQSKLLSQFRNAASIIERLQLILVKVTSI